MLSDGKEQDRRHSTRSHLRRYLRVFDGSSSRVIGHVTEITTQGLMLVSKESLSIHEEYRLRMKPGESISESGELIFRATCKWCRKDTGSPQFIAGFLVHDLSDRGRETIEKLVAEFGVLGQ